jgi:putative transcriptional regulator
MQGSLLIAHPLLNDGFFNRSVIYLTNHNDEGSLGFILNFKTQFKLRDVRPQVRNGNFPIYEGGPVAKDQLFFLHKLGEKLGDALHIKDNVWFGGDFGDLLHGIEHGTIKQSDVRFFVGYSGWGDGQLEKEIESKSWIMNDGSEKNIFIPDTDSLWKNSLQEKKPGYGIFADIGFDPSRN